MIGNFHIHTTFCDGKNTPEEIVQAALAKGFSAIGFSGHGLTPFDLRYCMKDTAAYIAEIQRLKSVYRQKIEIYLGIEEDALAPVDRSPFEYIIGSSHYFLLNGIYYPIDSNEQYFNACVNAFGGDILRLAETYFSSLCEYLHRRKPEIVGHFDVITKFDDVTPRFSCNREYRALACRYAENAAQSGCVFELNTGPVWRGYRHSPLPCEDVLHTLKKAGADIIISSDSHSIETLDYHIDEMRAYLRSIGFTHTVTLHGGDFIKIPLK